MPELLMGDEAVALGAMHAHIGGVFSYPGTPATEIFEYVARHASPGAAPSAQWSANEKVAYEEALGMSYVGRRALVSMKHVGLNVAADPFMSSALTGANGGLVVAVADDPSMHSSQNEQDTRFYAQFAQIPLFEPSNQQEAYDMTREAFELSERLKLPVIVRLVTRLAHSRSDVITAPLSPYTPLDRVTNWREWTLLPVNARPRYTRLLSMQPQLKSYAEQSPYNQLTLRGPKGVIATGLANNYLEEVLGKEPSESVLKLTVYPVPSSLVRELVDHCSEIILLEEGYPFIERQLLGLMGPAGKSIHGKGDGFLPAQGELTTDIVRGVLRGEGADAVIDHSDVPPRPPQLCDGCPHCDTYRAVVEAAGNEIRPYFFSDIGCYTLAALPPYGAIDTCVDMGASIGMAMGAARAGVHPVVATIGDSTFIHSGLSSLIGAAHDDLNMTVVILDNALVAMTGGQSVFTTGEALIQVIQGLGVPNKRIIQLNAVAGSHAENVERIQAEIKHPGLSVVVAQRACIHAKRRVRESVESSTVVVH